MHTPVSRRRARSIDVAQRVHEADVDPQRVGVLDRERHARGARDRASTGASAALERVGGLLPRERRRRSGREHQAPGAERFRGVDRADEPFLLLGPPLRVGEVERAEADEVDDARPDADRVDDARDAVVPAVRFELRDRHADVVDAVRGPEREIVGQREAERRDRADARARVHLAHPEREAAGDAAARRRAAGSRR